METIFTQVRLSNGHAVDVIEVKAKHLLEASRLSYSEIGHEDFGNVILNMLTITCNVNGKKRNKKYFENLLIVDYNLICEVLNAQTIKVK